MQSFRPTLTSAPAAALALVAVASVALLSGCGRKATEADCQALFDKIVELEMKNAKRDDPLSISKKQEELRLQMAPDMKECVGRRVTESLLACVRSAATSDAVVGCMK